MTPKKIATIAAIITMVLAFMKWPFAVATTLFVGIMALVIWDYTRHHARATLIIGTIIALIVLGGGFWMASSSPAPEEAKVSKTAHHSPPTTVPTPPPTTMSSITVPPTTVPTPPTTMAQASAPPDQPVVCPAPVPQYYIVDVRENREAWLRSTGNNCTTRGAPK